ncbi:choice-of-anchor L domain-containing protein [Nannocystis pusilla]|uniref:Choice-of-anchor L domain-containing protein n=1 Tax=Nannocystis pusilla TaxID=889268 RepID=A0ABS7THX9_9BACT|nr:choice-of-anchor L domain-containing protein [Nannocystis pusilla]MBZ5707819.1 choice-of-anchor L domain-containing protein [Nannocystis pusilla]
MVRTSIVRLLGLASIGLACGTTDPGATATEGGTELSLSGGPTSGETTTDSASDGAPTTSESGSASMTEGGSETGEPTTAGTTTTGDETTTTTGPVETTTTGETTDPGTTDTTGPVDTTGPIDTTSGGDEDCQAPAVQPPCDTDANDPFKAIGLNCSDNKSMAIPISNPVITSPDASAWRVATHYGSAMDPMNAGAFMWGPKEGERLLVIGTGTFPALQADGGLIEPDSFIPGENVSTPNGNPDNQFDLPGVMTYEKGSNNGNGGTPGMNCDGTQDCSDTLDDQWNIAFNNTANDVFYMSFDLEVPLGTHGYLFDFAYFSQEWPNWVGDAYNDMFVVWSTSETFTGNVTFINEQPLTVTALDPYMTIQPGDPLLAGTGFPDSFLGDTEGAGTGWFTAKGSAAPGEKFTVAISIFDMGDDVLDTIGLIDKFRWDCEGCIPSEVESCGVEPQPQ